MAEIVLDHCLGIDTRPAWNISDRWLCDAASNLQVMPGGSISTRPALRKTADLSSQSKGLYARGGSLRCVVASGHSYQSTAPTGVIYDGIGDGGATDYASKISSVLATDSFGISAIYGPYGYVVIQRSDNMQIEHHWVKDPPASFASQTNTRVNLPFQPGKAMIRIANKIVATSPAEGYFRYCSTVHGPSDWTTTGDAGFEAALQFVNGARDFIALGIHRGYLAVFFSDAVQLWAMDVDPANISLNQVLNGPGTDWPKSVANVLGDAVFFSRSGFANLTTADVTAQTQDRFAAVGRPIATLTANIATTDPLVSLWSQRRSQYLCANGTTVYCYSYYVDSNATQGYWTTWTMPTSVDAIAENAGVTYIRSGDTLYQLDDTTGTDYNGTDIAWSLQTKAMNFGPTASMTKALRHVTVQANNTSTWTPIADGVTLTSNAATLPSGTLRVVMSAHGRRIALIGSGSGLVRIDGVTLDAGMAGS